ncbi:DNA polymerase III subunit gamma/tau [Candidatus Uhrbacteria bacterium]|nr:DNA polymerase III subunit gamma/tau [Candidatus Uhrbacteria bacterium]
MSVTLYRKYRPKNWSDVAGQNHVRVTLAFEVESGRTAHAYMFSGPRGVGKTTIARILARALNCLDRKDGGEPCNRCEACLSLDESRTLDVIEIDAASHRGIDNVRDNIIENSRFAPSRLKYKVFIIDEVHMLTPEAFNALLKTLEEPPEHAVFILATTELHKVPATIVSRCQRFDFRRVPFSEMVERLHTLSEREGIRVDMKAIEAVVRQSDGCLRDAEGLLGKVMTLGDGKRVSYDEALMVLPRSDWQAAAGFVEAILHRDGRSALLTLDDCLEAGVEPDQFAGDVIELLRQLLLMKMGVSPETAAVEADEGQRGRFAAWRELASVAEVIAATETMMEKRLNLKAAHPPQLPLELAVARICEMGTAGSAVPAGTAIPEGEKAVLPSQTAGRKVAEKGAKATPRDGLGEGDNKTGGVEIAEAGGKKTVGESACSVTLERVRQVWTDFIRQSGEKSHSLTFLLGCAEPLAMDGNCLRVGFSYAFHCDKFNQEKSKRLMEEALKTVVGEDIRLDGIVTERAEEDYTCYVTHGPDEPDAVGKAGVPLSPDAQLSPDVPPSPVDALAAAFGGKVVG